MQKNVHFKDFGLWPFENLANMARYASILSNFLYFWPWKMWEAVSTWKNHSNYMSRIVLSLLIAGRERKKNNPPGGKNPEAGPAGPTGQAEKTNPQRGWFLAASLSQTVTTKPQVSRRSLLTLRACLDRILFPVGLVDFFRNQIKVGWTERWVAHTIPAILCSICRRFFCIFDFSTKPNFVAFISILGKRMKYFNNLK